MFAANQANNPVPVEHFEYTPADEKDLHQLETFYENIRFDDDFIDDGKFTINLLFIPGINFSHFRTDFLLNLSEVCVVPPNPSDNVQRYDPIQDMFNAEVPTRVYEMKPSCIQVKSDEIPTRKVIFTQSRETSFLDEKKQYIFLPLGENFQSSEFVGQSSVTVGKGKENSPKLFKIPKITQKVVSVPPSKPSNVLSLADRIKLRMVRNFGETTTASTTLDKGIISARSLNINTLKRKQSFKVEIKKSLTSESQKPRKMKKKLTCEKCGRVYVMEFHYSKHVAKCEGGVESPKPEIGIESAKTVKKEKTHLKTKSAVTSSYNLRLVKKPKV